MAKKISLAPLAVLLSAPKKAYAGVIGEVENPFTTGPLSGGPERATAILSRIIQLMTIGAGIYTLVNFVLAGIQFISSAGNPESVAKAWQKIYYSVIGLSVVFLSFAFAGLLGLLLYGEATAILTPTITEP